ncbi:MAG: cation transporter [Prevotella sp.]|nr:cation transporter [Prevotella sp.]
MKKVFTVTGMKCEHCEARVENAIKEVNGVNGVKADHTADNVTVEYDENAVSPSQLKDAVDALGRYELSL